MALMSIISGFLFDIAKDKLFSYGKNIVIDFFDSDKKDDSKSEAKKIGELVCYRKVQGYNNVLLLIHGFNGSASETFGCTPDLLTSNPEFDGWDIYSIGYSSDMLPNIGKDIWSVNPDITKISQYLSTIFCNQFSDYHRVAFVAHSMGGLAVQRLILDLPKNELNRISHVLLFGTPSAGLSKAYWFSKWNNQIQDLSTKSDFIQKLRRDWSAEFPQSVPFTFNTIAGTTDEFVPVESSLEPFDEKYRLVIEGNHITMIKPVDINDLANPSYQLIRQTLMGNKYLQGNSVDVNILLGEYHSIIKKDLLQVNELSYKNVANLVFALEATGKGKEAIEILKNHPTAKKKSDMLGIIGGRYKRKYLLEGLQRDLDQAFYYYKEGLRLSEGNPKQQFYHAINLAFLEKVGQDDEVEMKKYAQLALDNCISENKDVWELATVAEANLYLGNLATAKDFYVQAYQLAGRDVRVKQSIYSNAYYGYQSVVASNTKDADFFDIFEVLV